MAKSAPLPPPSMIQPLQDAMLFSGDYAWVFYLALAGYALANARAIAQPKMNYFHGCAMMVLASLGGSTMVAIMCGKAVPLVCNEALVPVCLAAWTAVYLVPAQLGAVLNNQIGRALTSVTYETFRCHVMMNCTKMAASAGLVSSAGGRVAIVGPLIAGLLGGCGGGFMPLSKGLAPLENGTNWRIASAAINSVWMFLSTQHPDSVAAIGIKTDTARCLAIAFFVTVPLVEAVSGMRLLGANPLVPAKAATSAKYSKKNN